MAHIMLPGEAPSKELMHKTKYAVDAIDEMLQLLKKRGSDESNLRFCLVGGGNVLEKEDDTICESNIRSVTNILNEKQLKVSKKELGGILRRSVRFDIEKAEVYFTVGDSDEKILWSW